VAAVASPIPVLVPVTAAIAMFAPLGEIKGFDDTWDRTW
jgi:low affinity Fe/Cu permease